MIWLMTYNTAATNENLLDTTHFSIAPNPTEDKQLHFTFTLDEIQNTTVALYDTLGRMVKEVQLNQLNNGINYQSIDASNLEFGLYICKLSNPTGSKSVQVIIK